MKTPCTCPCPLWPVGVTILEFLLLIGIIAVLGWAFVRFRPDDITCCGHGGFSSTEAKINQLRAAVQSYETYAGVLPSAEQGLKALLEKPVSQPEPRLWVKLASEPDLLDSWKTPFGYHVPSRSGADEFEIVSAGPDRVMNTPDDISSVHKGD